MVKNTDSEAIKGQLARLHNQMTYLRQQKEGWLRGACCPYNQTTCPPNDPCGKVPSPEAIRAVERLLLALIYKGYPCPRVVCGARGEIGLNDVQKDWGILEFYFNAAPNVAYSGFYAEAIVWDAEYLNFSNHLFEVVIGRWDEGLDEVIARFCEILDSQDLQHLCTQMRTLDLGGRR